MTPDGHEPRQFITNCIRNKKDSSDIVATSLPPLALLPNPANILESLTWSKFSGTVGIAFFANDAGARFGDLNVMRFLSALNLTFFFTVLLSGMPWPSGMV